MMINKMIHYIKDDTFKFKYFNNNLNVQNYKEIKIITNNLISFTLSNNKLITIYGEELVLKKILEKELLIGGCIKKIEM